MSDAINAAQDALRRKQMGRLPHEGDRNLIYDACNEAIAANASLTTRNAELAAECERFKQFDELFRNTAVTSAAIAAAKTLINVAAEGAAQRILADGDYDDDATLVATAYLGEVVEAKRLEEQWQETYAAAMAAKCTDMELHCTCVGTLQEQIRR